MSKTKTPAQALEAIQQVYDIAFIRRPDNPDSAHYSIGIGWPNGKYRALLPSPDWDDLIDWPLGVYQWPLPEKWRPAVMPQDYGKRCRFADIKPDHWKNGKVAGYCARTEYNWIDDDGIGWTFCEVED